ncbi:archease [Candidatus Omnitrophota bacterium]
MKRYEQIPHTADLAARIYGKDMPELFKNAAYAMFDIMSDLEGAERDHEERLEVEATDAESLLISWLNEALYLSYVKQLVFTEFKIISLDETRLTAVLKGSSAESRVTTEIKAATYHDLKITETEEGYEVTVVFDI